MASSDDVKQYVHNQTEVALRLTREVLLKEAAGYNAIFSPLSIHVLLSMVAAGSAGPQKDQLLTFLKAESTEQLHAYASEVVAAIFVNHPTAIKPPKLNAANGVWIDDSLSFKPAFEDVLGTVYKAVTNRVDFKTKPAEVVREVNAWAEKETNGLIKNALPSNAVTSETLIILANALYFKAAWHYQFEHSSTRDDNFHLLDGSSIRVPFMSSFKDVGFSVHDGFKILNLSYRQSKDTQRRFSMCFILPDARDGLPALVDRVCSEPGFLDRHRSRHGVKVREYRIPKFKISLGLEASNVLSKMGLRLECLTDMVEHVPGGRGLVVSHIIHKAAIEIDEEGTEAAAFSAVCEMGYSLEQEVPQLFDFIADHPFMFVIREKMTGIVLFTGQVLDPSRQDGLDI